MLTKLAAHTDGEIKLAEAETRAWTARNLQHSLTDDLLIVWLILIFTLPFMPSLFILLGFDPSIAERAAESARQATKVVFGDNAGYIMSGVVAAVLGIRAWR